MNHSNRLLILAFQISFCLTQFCATVSPAVLAVAALAAPVAGGFFVGLSSRMFEEKFDFRGNGVEDASLDMYLHKLYHTGLIAALGVYSFIAINKDFAVDVAGTVSLLSMHAYTQGRNVWAARDNRNEVLMLTRQFKYTPQLAIGLWVFHRTPGAMEYVKTILHIPSR